MIEEVACWSCDGDGNGFENQWFAVRVSLQVLRFLYLPAKFYD